MKVLKITGVGKLDLVPNEIILNILIREIDENYDIAVKAVDEKTAKLKDSLGQCGNSALGIKSTDYRVNREIRQVRDKEGNYKDEYKFASIQNLMVSFPFDKTELKKVLNAITKTNSEIEFDIRLDIKDKEMQREKVIELAVLDARKKAEIIAKSAGIKLGEIVSVTYDNERANFNSQPRLMSVSATSRNGYTYDVDPKDITLSEAVFVEYEII